jgi:CHAT domain-containing protein
LHGSLDVAEAEADQARNRFSNRDADWSMKFRLLEGEILTYQGRRTDVVKLLSDKTVSYPETGDAAIEKNLLCGLAHAGLGQTLQSDQELRQARVLSDLSNSPLDGEVLRAEAKVQLTRQNLNAASDLYKKSLQVARRHGDAFLEATDLLNLGFVALQMEHYDEAVALFQDAANFAKTVQARPVTEAALGNMGDAFYRLGDYEKALSNFQAAERQAEEIGTTSAQVVWLWEAGSSYYKLGDLKAARICYERALKSATAINAADQISDIQTQLALMSLQEGQFDFAKTQSDDAIRAAYSSGDKATEADAKFVQALLAIHQSKEQNAEQMLIELHKEANESPSMQWRIEDALAKYFSSRQNPKEAETWYRKSIQTFEDKRSEVKDADLKLPFFANGNELYMDYAGFLISSHKENEALKLLDLGRARTLAEGLRIRKSPPTIREEGDPRVIARKLHATILFYALGPERSYLWAVTANRTDLFVLPKKQEIESRVQNYQKAILKSSDALREANADGRYLYDTIVSPAASMITNGAKVFVIPDGGLNSLNFETLLKPEGEKLHYWIEDVTLTNANSIRLLSRLDSSSSSTDANNLLLIGNPVSSGSEYESLPNAPAEVDEIKRHFRPDRETVLTQAEAVPSAYGTVRPDRFEYIHFVAHGTASRLSPLDSAVVLSASAGQRDDYKLYAREIVRHPLHARLVTISSCYGSGLRAYAGEELVGLSWAFLRAGAHNVIGALWEVNDASTPQLMDRMYGGLEKGRKPDEALRTAKLAMMHSEGVTRKPMYWAAFQLYAGS